MCPSQQPASAALAELRNWFELTGDRSVLTKILQTARACQLRSGNDFGAHMMAHSAWLAALPGCLRMGGSYMAPHLTRKHALGFEARALRKGSGVDWNKYGHTVTALQQLMPDQSGFLKAAPSWLKPRALSAQLGCGLLWLSMWPCLMKEVLRAWPGCAAIVEAHLPQIEACLRLYKAAFHISPCPFVLIREFLKTLPAAQRPAGKNVYSGGEGGEGEADGSEEEEEEGEETAAEADFVGGGAPVRKRTVSVGGGATARSKQPARLPAQTAGKSKGKPVSHGRAARARAPKQHPREGEGGWLGWQVCWLAGLLAGQLLARRAVRKHDGGAKDSRGM